MKVKDILKAKKLLDLEEKKNPLVELKSGDCIMFEDGSFLRWKDLKPRKK